MHLQRECQAAAKRGEGQIRELSDQWVPLGATKLSTSLRKAYTIYTSKWYRWIIMAIAVSIQIGVAHVMLNYEVTRSEAGPGCYVRAEPFYVSCMIHLSMAPFLAFTLVSSY